ncbi:hypothetical protein E0Z10_g10229 [Xylaria hypoxylon]|uniref:Uncharacterized protein n=1 Tax=Xylaria hypoxylon TaxID=37992 RepID=A0A4Z0YPJ3_9PEZI|nr:hypothetical protein E0Z10_g10229 [Xylaria hypoxylon]
MDIIYINGEPEGYHERKVAAQGWKWMRTNTINPTQFNTRQATMNSGEPDRLPTHSHHGPSTHMVISGDLRVKKHNGDKGMYEISDAPRSQDLVLANMEYSGTSRTGCSFVEGHMRLGPQLAGRFIDRGTLKVVRKPRTQWPYPSNADLKTWLRTVKFNPDGKTEPDEANGEKPILDARLAESTIPPKFLYDLSRWFEDEWRELPRYPIGDEPSWQINKTPLLALLFAVLAWFAYKILW